MHPLPPIASPGMNEDRVLTNPDFWRVPEFGGSEPHIVDNPPAFVAGMRKSHLRADILTFAQKIPDTEAKYGYEFRSDNWRRFQPRASTIGGKRDCRKSRGRMFAGLRNVES